MRASDFRDRLVSLRQVRPTTILGVNTMTEDSLLPQNSPDESGLLAYWHPENARVAAALLIPEVTFNGAFVVVELVLSSEGLQSGVLAPSVVNAKASIV